MPDTSGPGTVCSDQPLIRLAGVTLRSHGQTLFEGTSWQIRKGECWAIVGANGSGKSTLARALCGQVPVTAGQISYAFDEGQPAPHRRVAVVSFQEQRNALIYEPTYHQARWNVGANDRSLPVTEYLAWGAAQRRRLFEMTEEQPVDTISPAQQQEVITRLGIQPLLRKDLTQLSSGERRKVSIARTLFGRPRVLILENPFTGLDSTSRESLQQVIEGLAEQEVEVILVTARLDTLPSSVTHVLLVDQGRVVAQGERGAVLREARARQTGDTAVDPIARAPSAQLGHEQPALVRMRNVGVRYRSKSILADVNWTVTPGEHWALLGPNGAGKTTLLSLILGDHPQAYANDIALFGKQRGTGESIWEIKAHIGWVAPELHLHYPERSSGLDIVCSGFVDTIEMREPCTTEQRAAAERWMRELGVAEYSARRFGTLSESQQRLILIARAVVKMPRLLILDEPCQGLDALNRARVSRVVELVGGASETTIIYVTHDADELPSIITHLLRLEQGQVAYCGPIDHKLSS